MDRRVSFKNNRGFKLVGVLRGLKEEESLPVVIFAHGLYSGKDSPRNTRIAEGLVSEGIAAFLMDFTGHGDSEGVMSDASVEQFARDIDSAIIFLGSVKGVDPNRIGVCGSSLGGTAALLAASSDERIKALVLRNAPTAGYHHLGARIKIPALVVQGEDDPILEESKELFKHLAGEKRIELIKGAGHLWEEAEQLDKARDAIVRWFKEKL